MAVINFTEIKNIARIFLSKNGVSLRLIGRNFATNEKPYTLQKKKIIHPYRKIHPWRSKQDFCKCLMENILYDKDGLVAINKPYGISGRSIPQNNDENEKLSSTSHMMTPVANAVNYTVEDVLPDIAEALRYPSLEIAKAPDKYTTGVLLLTSGEKMMKRVTKSWNRATSNNLLPITHWIVTTKLPKEIKGKMNVAIGWEYSQDTSKRKPVILKSWSKAQVQRDEVKLLKVDFELLSNSTGNYCSFMQLRTSTRKWHAVRLFAATVLHSPILGDNLYGSRIQQIMGTWLDVNPFSPGTEQPPSLNKHLLELLHLDTRKQDLIPAHIHIRSFLLPTFTQSNDLVIEAPLMPPFDWTCKKLMFKNIPDVSPISDERDQELISMESK